MKNESKIVRCNIIHLPVVQHFSQVEQFLLFPRPRPFRLESQVNEDKSPSERQHREHTGDSKIELNMSFWLNAKCLIQICSHLQMMILKKMEKFSACARYVTTWLQLFENLKCDLQRRTQDWRNSVVFFWRMKNWLNLVNEWVEVEPSRILTGNLHFLMKIH